MGLTVDDDDGEAQRLIELLGLAPHAEGGWWAQTWLGPTDASHRPQASAIVFLLRRNERSHWHSLDVTEVWHHHRGATVVLRLWPGHGPVHEHRLGAHIEHGDRPQVVVPAGWWQSAAPDGGYALVGCTMGPGFWLDGWELAPRGWEPDAS